VDPIHRTRQADSQEAGIGLGGLMSPTGRGCARAPEVSNRGSQLGP